MAHQRRLRRIQCRLRMDGPHLRHHLLALRSYLPLNCVHLRVNQEIPHSKGLTSPSGVTHRTTSQIYYMRTFLCKLGRTIALAALFVLFIVSIIYWKIAKRLKPSKKEHYEHRVTQILFCGLVPCMMDFDRTWNVKFFGDP